MLHAQAPRGSDESGQEWTQEDGGAPRFGHGHGFRWINTASEFVLTMARRFVAAPSYDSTSVYGECLKWWGRARHQGDDRHKRVALDLDRPRGPDDDQDLDESERWLREALQSHETKT